MKTLYVVRHGQTLFNKLKKMQGACDSPLTKLGIEQAKVARDYFKQEAIEFTHAYSSTSERAFDTLEIITDMDYQMRKNLKEISFGIYEAQDEFLNQEWPPTDFFVDFGGESGTDFTKRVIGEVEGIMQAKDHQSVLIVAHGGVLSALMKNLPISSEFDGDGHMNNCTILKYQIDEVGNFLLIDKIDHDFSHLLDLE